MLKQVLIGIWVALVTAASAYFSTGFMTPKAGPSPEQQRKMGLEELVSDMVSVPVARGDAITGYIIVQFTFEADKAGLAELKVDPKPFLADATFRSVYAESETDFSRLRAADIDRLVAEVRATANARMNADIVKSVLIKELNYVRKEDIRTHWIKKD